MNLGIKNTVLSAIIIAWLQIVSGSCGIIFMYDYFISPERTLNKTEVVFGLLGTVAYLLSLTAGTFLLNKVTRNLGLVLSLVNFVLQIVQFNLFDFTFRYALGLAVLIGYDKALAFDLDIPICRFTISNNPDIEPFFLVNAFAVVLIIILLNIWNERNNQK